MYGNLEVFRLAGAMAGHAAQRQAIVATNIANADTPGYRARQLAGFAESYDAATTVTVRTTRSGHLSAEPGVRTAQPGVGHAEASPNGNSVSLEQEMLASVDAAREHSRALAIYRHAMTVIRSSLGR